jgi:hypothetical protein
LITLQPARWPAVQKDADETYSVALSVWTLCAAFWQANEEYSAGDFAWPTVRVENGQFTKGPTGFVYECTQGGRSAAREPRWGITPDTIMTALDGSVQWTTRVGALQGLQPVSNPTVAQVTGKDNTLVISDPIVSEGTKILVDYSGGTLGLDYTVEFEFNVGGRVRVGRQVVQIRQI